jgi:hypothetical protein
VRAARRRVRGEPVAHPAPAVPIEADWAIDAIDPIYATAAREQTKVETIIARLEKRCEQDLASATYRNPTARYVRPAVTTRVLLAEPTSAVPPSVWISRQRHLKIENGKHRTSCSTYRTACTTPREAFATRIALGGTQLVHDGEQRLFAASVLERKGWGPSEMVVLLCKQERGLAASSAPALVRRESAITRFVRWLKWPQLAPETIAVYGEFLQRGAKCHSSEIIATALEATRGQPAYAEVRQELAEPNAHGCRHTMQRIARLNLGLSALPPLKQLQEEYPKCAELAKRYAAEWGELVGCQLNCVLFAGDLDNITQHFPFTVCGQLSKSIAVQHHMLTTGRLPSMNPIYPCQLLAPLAELCQHYGNRLQAEQELKEEQRLLAEGTRTLKRYGYRLDDGGNLEELP